MEPGFQNISQPGSFHTLSRFQDLYYPSYSYEPSKTTQRPYHQAPILQNDEFSDRVYFGSGGWGWSGSNRVGGAGNSAAISALGLLAFLFFLNLIQNSIINNRWLLLNFSANRTSLLPIIGRSEFGRDLDTSWFPTFLGDDFESVGKQRQEQGPDAVKEIHETPVSIQVNPNDQDSGTDSKLLHYKEINLRKMKRFKRQLNGAVTGRFVGIPLRCVVQLKACRILRFLKLGKRFRNRTPTITLTRRFVLLPVRDQAGRNRLLQVLVPQRSRQPRKTCRVLFNQCRNVTLITPP